MTNKSSSWPVLSGTLSMAGALLLATCGGGPRVTLDLQLPSILRFGVMNMNRVEVTVGGKGPWTIDFVEGTLSGEVGDLPLGTHHLELDFYATSTGGEVQVARYEGEVEIGSGGPGEKPGSWDLDFDDDGDGTANLREVILGTDPTDEGSRPAGLDLLVPDNLLTIQAAVEFALPGDTIVVKPNVVSWVNPSGNTYHGEEVVIGGGGGGSAAAGGISLMSCRVAETSPAHCPGDTVFWRGSYFQQDEEGGGQWLTLEGPLLTLDGVSQVTIRGFVFLVENQAGVGMRVEGTTEGILLADSYFAEATGGDGGGAIHLVNAKGVTIRNNIFFDNRAGRGGAILAKGSTVEVRFNTFVDNQASPNEGEAVQFEGAGLGSTISTNIFDNPDGHELPPIIPFSDNTFPVEYNLFWIDEEATVETHAAIFPEDVTSILGRDPDLDRSFRPRSGSPALTAFGGEEIGAYGGGGSPPTP